MKAVVFTLGCKVNESESASVISALENAGFKVYTEGHLGKEKLERINFICKRL